MGAAIVFFTQSIGSFVIDATMEETHSETAQVTRFPVEVGSNISDHAQIMPRTFDIVCAKTNFPNSYDPTIISDAYETLVALHEAREPFTVVTGLTVLDNMIIENFSITQDKRTANVGFFIVSLKQIIIVGTGSTQGSSPTRAVSSEGSQNSNNAGPVPAPSLLEQETENRAAEEIENRPGNNQTYWQQGPAGFTLVPDQQTSSDTVPVLSETEANRLISLVGG